ncbi:hypothetical protein, partial [Saccharopolyspora elongata]|uniref:hypothetical protein n=1 Tax=Saccharopolyspora elongata TaxID=2530387 RepID=UPI001A9EC3D5
MAFHNSLVLGELVVAEPAGDVRDPARLVAAGGKAWRVDGLAEAEGHVRSLPVGRDVSVIFQRADFSAHAINAVHVAQGVVGLGDAQKGEEGEEAEKAEEADVLAATGVWVVELPWRQVVLPAGDSGLRSQGWGAGLPAEVTGPPRRYVTIAPKEVGESSSEGSKRPRVEGPDGDGSRNQGGEGDGSASVGRALARKLKKRKYDADRYQKEKADPNWEKEKKKDRGVVWRQEQKKVADEAAALKAKAATEGLTEKEAEKLEELLPRAQKYWDKYEKHKKQTVARRREIKDAADSVLAELREFKRQGTLPSWRLPELEVREEIKRYEDEENRLAVAVSRKRKKTEESRGEIKKLEASEVLADADQERLRTLQKEVDGWDSSRQKLTEVRDRLAEKKEELESVLARGEAGSGRIADV